MHLPFPPREITFVTSLLLFARQAPSARVSTLQGKNLLLERVHLVRK